MKAVIPVAGVGSRMRPHTLNHAKVLLPVAGRPMISYILDELLENGIDEIIFIVGYLGEQIETFVKDNYGSLNVSFVRQQEMLGLGHAVYMAEPFVGDDELLIILGDTLFDVEFKKLISTPYSNLGVKRVEDPSRFGVAVIESDFIVKLVEKPQEPISNLALVGLYYVKNGKFLMKSIEKLMGQNIKTSGEFQLTDALQIMIDEGEKFIPFTVENWYDCGKPETILATNAVYLKKERNNAEEFTSPHDSKIIDPVHLAPDVVVRNAVIGPNVSVGKGTVIENCVITNSIIGEESNLQNCVLDNSIVGNHTKIRLSQHTLNVGDYSELS